MVIEEREMEWSDVFQILISFCESFCGRKRKEFFFFFFALLLSPGGIDFSSRKQLINKSNRITDFILKKSLYLA